MINRKISAALLSALALALTLPLQASASFGSGAGVIAEDMALLKSGTLGERICFRDTDFKSALGIHDFSEITIKSLPSESSGSLIYAGKVVRAGQKIKRRNIPSLLFIPASDKVREARFSFSVKGLADGRDIDCILRFRSGKNSAPSTDASHGALQIPSEGDAIYGTLGAADPDGDIFEFLVADYPEHGTLSLEKNGDFLYTPPVIRKKSDSFSYVVRDEWGYWSEPTRLRITYAK